MPINPGDSIYVHINKDNEIVNLYDGEYDRKEIVDVVANIENGHIILIPPDVYVKGCITLKPEDCVHYGIDKKFVNAVVIFISSHRVISVHSKLTGLACSRCLEWFEFAEANQPDGKTLLCFLCRTYKYR